MHKSYGDYPVHPLPQLLQLKSNSLNLHNYGKFKSKFKSFYWLKPDYIQLPTDLFIAREILKLILPLVIENKDYDFISNVLKSFTLNYENTSWFIYDFYILLCNTIGFIECTECFY